MNTISAQSRGKFTSTTIDKVEKEGIKISSTLIRENIRSGNVDILPDLLGRYYEIEGTIVTGDKRGRTIGFPTANISPTSQYMLPKEGVYTVRLKVDDLWHNGVLNIGYKPTFHDHLPNPTVEVHLLDFNDNIYGEHVTLEWRKRIRDEKKFHSADALIEQLNEDKRIAISYFEFAI